MSAITGSGAAPMDCAYPLTKRFTLRGRLVRTRVSRIALADLIGIEIGDGESAETSGICDRRREFRCSGASAHGREKDGVVDADSLQQHYFLGMRSSSCAAFQAKLAITTAACFRSSGLT